MTRGQRPEQGAYEVRQHMATGVLGIFWVDTPGTEGTLAMTLADARFPLLVEAVNTFDATPADDRPTANGVTPLRPGRNYQ